MRIRTIKPEWLEDERMALASSDARVLSVGLILLADDHGRGRANPLVVSSRIFPGDSRKFAEASRELREIGFVRFYEVDGQHYFEIKNWNKHQRIDKPGKPQVPAPREDSRESRESSRESRESSWEDRKGREGKGKEGRGSERAGARAAAAASEPWVDPEPEPSPNAPKPATVRGALVAGYREAFEREFRSMPTDVRGSEADEAVRAVLARASVLERDPCELAKSAAAHWFRENAAKWQKPPRWAWFLKDIGGLLADAVANESEPLSSEAIDEMLRSLTGSPS